MGIHKLVDRALCDLSASISNFQFFMYEGKMIKARKYTIGNNSDCLRSMFRKMAGCDDFEEWAFVLFSNLANSCHPYSINAERLKGALHKKISRGTSSIVSILSGTMKSCCSTNNEKLKTYNTADFSLSAEAQLHKQKQPFRLYLSLSTDKKQIIMATQNGLKAFVIGKTAAYAKARNSKKFRQIVNGNPLQLFTAYIQGKELEYGEYYEGELPQIDEKVQEIEFVLIKDNDNN